MPPAKSNSETNNVIYPAHSLLHANRPPNQRGLTQPRLVVATVFSSLIAIGAVGVLRFVQSGRGEEPAGAVESFRVWTDSTGKFRTTAKLIEAADEKVKLQREDGSVVDVPVSRLSDGDRAYLKSH